MFIQAAFIAFLMGLIFPGEDQPGEFEELQEYGWLRARAQEFGFHLSYPRGGPSAFEPWHWRWEEK